MATATQTKNFVTTAQLNFVKKLVSQDKDLTQLPAEHASTLRSLMDEMPVERYACSKLIDALLELKKPAKSTAEVEPGYYVHNNFVYVVVESKNTGRKYAKRLDIGARAVWNYAPGAAAALLEVGAPVLTLEEASRLGHMHGFCMVCGRALTQPKSVEAGIGPICAGKL